MAEITDTGYVLKPLNDWFSEEEQFYLDIDPDWNTDPSTPDGLKIAHDSEIFANLDELVQRAYNSKDPNKAVDVDLDFICLLSGVRRDKGSPSTVTLSLGGVGGTVIPAGSVVQSSEDGSQWETVNYVTLNPGGLGTTLARCTVNGATEAAVGTITQIIDTVGGWQTVTNTTVATLGRGVQSNQSLRVEREQTVGRSGQNQVESIIGNVYAVDGVRDCKVYENEEDYALANGMPPHSTAVVVDGGADADIARAIYDKRSTGVKQHTPGTPVVVDVTSKIYPGHTQKIKFSRPVYTDITVAVTIENDGSLPSDIVDRVKDAIVAYSIGDLIDPACGFNPHGFRIAENVNASRLYTPVNSVIGQYGASYISALTVNSGQEVTIAYAGKARFSSSNITVTVQ